MKKQFFGGVKTKLHASELHGINEKQIQAVGDFFKKNLFSRFAATIRKETVIELPMHNYHLVASVLRQRIADVASAHALDSMTLIVESSQRGNRLLRRYMSDIVLKDGHGNELPVYKHIMSKKAGEPGLEVADFVIHTAGGQALKRMKKSGNTATRQDYNCVFQSVPKQLISTFDVDVVSLQDEADRTK